MKTDRLPAINALAAFFAEYSTVALASGATCLRLEKNVERMASAFGASVDIAIMPRHVHMTLSDLESGQCVTVVAGVKPRPLSFDAITSLSALSWEVYDGKADFEQARCRLDQIASAKKAPGIAVVLLATAANASFCRLFDGDPTAMLVVAGATFAGLMIKNTLLKLRCDVRLTFFICAFVSAVIGSTCLLFDIGGTQAVALGTSVLYLVPGIPFLNSFSDLLNRHYICAFSRFTDAVVLTCCLSAGLCAAMWVMGSGMF